MYLSNNDAQIVWAAMQAMVNDIHAPQDHLSEAQWNRAAELLEEMDGIVGGFGMCDEEEED